MKLRPLGFVLLLSASALAAPPDGASVLKFFGSGARALYTKGPGPMSAVVSWPAHTEMPAGVRAMAPGVGTVSGEPADLLLRLTPSPQARLELVPPLRTLLDNAGQWVHVANARANGLDGRNVLVAFADSGLDVTLPDFLDEAGHTRVAWMLDLSLPPAGLYPDLERQFGVTDASGNVLYGAVLDAAEIDRRIASGGGIPGDSVGHGTHVASIAAGNGGLAAPSPYVGMAPSATILFSRIMRAGTTAIQNGDLLSGVAFLMNRADAMAAPVVVNLSLGSDFGPHDGTTAMETAFASFIGPSHPGRAIVVSAGNSGDITYAKVHANVYVPRDGTTRVPLSVPAGSGDVQLFVTMHPGAKLKVGLDGPSGTWIAPVGVGQSAGVTAGGANAGVFNGSAAPSSPVPDGSNGAAVIWTGTWPGGEYAITLQGGGGADLYVEASSSGDGFAGGGVVSFDYGTREGTITIPATHPALLSVGCTVNRTSWIDVASNLFDPTIPELDATGLFPLAPPAVRSMNDGEVCWFGSAGPTALGVQKPEIAAPGAYVIGAMSQLAPPNEPSSMFAGGNCPPSTSGSGTDPLCYEIDTAHGLGVGTSMSAPLVSGAIALLFQRDPTLTLGEITTLLQAGAHRFRGPSPFDDQSGPGELDIAGALAALEARQLGQAYLPSSRTSWMTLGAERVAADGTLPFPVILELRDEDGVHLADLFDASRLALSISVGGEVFTSPLSRRGAGVFSAAVTIPSGHGGESMTLQPLFDGVALTPARTVPIAVSPWETVYPPSVSGGCSVGVVGR